MIVWRVDPGLHVQRRYLIELNPDMLHPESPHRRWRFRDGAANIDDVKVFLKRNKAARTALKGNDKYAGGDFRTDQNLILTEKSSRTTFSRTNHVRTREQESGIVVKARIF